MKTKKIVPAKNNGFRPGARGVCEAQLWRFTGPPETLRDDSTSEVLWVAAESLDAALEYLRERHGDFTIVEARFVDMIPLLSGAPLD
jgi:hypothetical protein